MRALASVLALLLLAACGKGGSASKEVTGTLSAQGEATTVTKCRPDRGLDGVYVVLETAKGALRFESKRLWWNSDADALAPGAVLDCKKLDRSWGGGTRPDGTSYFRGMLDFDCHDGPNVYAGKLTLDCGNITADERASLDANRKKLQDEQKAAQGAVGSGSGSGSATP